MAQITWKNITAPNPTSTVAAQLAAGSALSGGFQNFSNIFGDLENQRKDEVSNAALSKAMGINSISDWDRIMGGGLESLGIKPEDASGELLGYLDSRRGQLLNEQTSKLNYENGLRQRDLSIKAYDDNKAGAALAEEAIRGNYNAEDGLWSLRNNSDVSPDIRTAAVKYFSENSGDRFTPDSSELVAVQGVPTVRNWGKALESDRIMDDFNLGSDEPLRAWMTMQEQYSGYENPLQGVTKNLDGFNGNLTTEEGKSVPFDVSEGDIADALDSAYKAHPGVPKEVVAGVLEQQVRSGSAWLLNGNKLRLDEGAASDLLDNFSDPTKRRNLEINRQRVETERENRQALQSTIDRKAMELALARSRNSPAAEIQQREQELMALGQQVNAMTGAVQAQATPNAPATASGVPGQAAGSPPAAAAQTPPAPPANPNVAPSIAAFNRATGATVENTSGGLGQGIDYINGQLVGTAGTGAALLGEGAAHLLGTVAPETGTNLLNASRDFYNQMGQINKEGLTPNDLFSPERKKAAADLARQERIIQASQSSAGAEVDRTDDARSFRGFGKSAYQDGLIDTPGLSGSSPTGNDKQTLDPVGSMSTEDLSAEAESLKLIRDSAKASGNAQLLKFANTRLKTIADKLSK